FGRRGVFCASFGAGPEVPMVASDRHGGLFLAAEWARRKSETSRAKGGFLIAHLTAGGELDRDFGRIETGFGRNTKAMLSSLWVDRRGRPLVAGLIESPLLAGRWGVAITRYRVPR
ncbi:MAG TPA: hypothetical protein VFS26_01285, partial [Solirubrobacterales bacterium]|nr:hypothetical protein [Solirubrobacterales bacterium]